ncbi:MAG: 16S rRNA (guanine(966)-N(2))-methyltransferase RsmD [Bacteroidales bacterium]|nr:16S rRNA (guanine(966)-N(2))-methyltransferase RsmD [Bacteroidales bacterium]
MRIISGYFKGKRFTLPKNLKLRPTTDMAKESLFNVINNLVDFEDIDALDLFSGTGSISYELVSRGVNSVLSVEQNGQHARFIESIIDKLEMENMRILKMDVFQFIKTNKRAFDFVFADPPYDMPELNTLPNLVFSSNLLQVDGMFVLEHPKHTSFTEHPNFFDHRKYGNVNFTFFKNNKDLTE